MDDAEACTKLVTLVKESYPEVKIVARARDRMHAIQLARLGVDGFTREMFEGALAASKQVLNAMGYSDGQTDYMANVFANHDAKFLQHSIEQDMSIPDLIQSNKQGREELKELFDNDKKEILP